jgi:hypothetical protein
MADLGQSGFGEFDRLLGLVHRTRELLDAVVGRGRLPDGGADYLAAQTLPHIEDVRSGFRGWLRADSAEVAELHYLVLQDGAIRVSEARTPGERRAALAEEILERALAQGTDPELERAGAWELAALAHARLVLAFMPRLPAVAVRFPAGRPTYADIPTPRGPAELSERIEELERELWRTATGRPPRPTDPAFRRTYGFFDAADHLAQQGLSSA